MITWTLLICLMVGYLAILSITTIAVQPARVRLVEIIDEMLDEPGWTKAERGLMEFMIDSCSSSTPGLLLPFAAVYGLAEAVLKESVTPEPKLVKFENDPRHPKIATLFLISIGGVSPFAMLLSIPLALLALVVFALRGEKSLSQAMEAPLRKMSSSLKTC